MLRRFIFVLVASALALVAAVPAVADTQPAAGTFTELPEATTGAHEADGNLILDLTRLVTFTGTYDGVGQAQEQIVIHKDGSTNVHIMIQFTGLACGQPAALEFLVVGQGQLDENFETGTIAGTWTVIDSGQTDSRTLRGEGTFTGIAGVSGVYEGQAHCDALVP